MNNDEKLKSVSSELEKINTNISQLKEEKEKIVTGIKKDIKSWYRKWALKIFGSISFLAVIGIWQIYTKVIDKSEKFITNSITVKFAEPLISQTLIDVAENQAQNIIKNTLNPEIAKATLSISEKTNIFNKNLNELKDNYDSQFKSLKIEVDYIKQRNDLFKLGDIAIANGDATALDKLNNLFIDPNESNKELKTIALSEIFRIKSHFALMTRIKGVKPQWIDPKTKNKITIDNLPTEQLIAVLSKEQIWQIRAKCAEHLKSRKEKGVPEALLNAIKNDAHLEVRKKAMDSFQQVTGFKSSDVLEYAPALKWWDKNKEDINENLKEQQTIKMYYKKNTMESENGEKD